jgi:hypothetical protein
MLDLVKRRHNPIAGSHAAGRNAAAISVFLVVSGAAILSLMAAAGLSATPPTILTIPAVLGCWLVWPRARPSMLAPISPINVAHMLFVVQLIVVPLAAHSNGYSYGSLWRLPGERSIALALLIELLAYAAFCASYHHYAARTRERDRHILSVRPTPSRRDLRRRIAPLYLVVGLVGAYSTYGSLQGYLDYFSRPESGWDASADLESTLVGTIGTFFRPFLGAAIVSLWSLCVTLPVRSVASALRVRVVTLVAGVLLLLSSASYNRGSMVAPLIALMGAYSLHVRRVRPMLLLLLAIPGTAAVLLWGEYRASTNVEFADLLKSDSVRGMYGDTAFGENLQVYGQGPQFLAFFLEETGFGSRLWYGRTILPSVLYPIPVLGRSFRAGSSVALYNRLIYNDDTTLDQIVPFAGELFLNFHVIGVVVGYLLLGRAVHALQIRFLRSTNAFEAYLWCLAGIWTSFLIIGNIAILSQICVYFFWPFYLYGLAALWGYARRTLRARQPAITVTS